MVDKTKNDHEGLTGTSGSLSVLSESSGSMQREPVQNAHIENEQPEQVDQVETTITSIASESALIVTKKKENNNNKRL